MARFYLKYPFVFIYCEQKTFLKDSSKTFVQLLLMLFLVECQLTLISIFDSCKSLFFVPFGNKKMPDSDPTLVKNQDENKP